MDAIDGLIGALLGSSDMAGAEFVSGYGGGGSMDHAALLGALSDIASGDMSDIAGASAEFLSGQDPVSALLGDGDMAGFSLNPINWFRHKKAKQALVKHAINQKLMRNGAAVVSRQNQKARRFPSPVTATVVAGGASATIAATPQTLFRPERLVVPASLAPSFVLTDLKVGNVSQFPNAGELPLEIFAQTGVDCTIELDTVNPALNLSVTVTNITGGSLTFRAGFIGTSVQ